DFRNVVLLMTTNAGAREMSAEDIGFRAHGADDEASRKSQAISSVGSKSKSAIERTFTPEFRNRLDGWVVFNPLTIDDIRRVVDKFINELREQLTEKNINVDISDAARDWLPHQCFHRVFRGLPAV